MSRWTHINSVFRLNSIGRISDEKIEQVFGKCITFDKMYDYEADGNPKTLPMGSEGTLEISVWHNPDKSCLASTTVSVFGDLRDFGGEEDIKSLKDWFDDCCHGFSVRQAIIQIEDEWNENPIIIAYKDMNDD